MNKTIIININGTVFHIEENAYEILKHYMTGVKRHFFDSEDSLEITTDIENRIAELFTEILHREGRQAIIDQDVNFVIEQMGAVEDFESPAADGGTPYIYPGRVESRRLFRDADDYLVAGVCSGIANYFDTQAVWIRLAFAISVVFAGTGLFLYIILWIVLPKAVTRADRMAMKGEKLDLQGFKKNFEAEVSNVRERLADVHHEAKPFIYRFRDFISEFFSFLGSFLGQTGKLLLKLFGLVFLITFFVMAIALIILLITVVGFGHNDLHYIFPFSVIGYRYDTWIYVSAFVVGIVPLLVFILLISRAVFNTQSINRSIGSTLLIVWICGLSTLIYFASRVSANYRWSASFNETINVKPVKGNIYHLVLNDVQFFTAEDSARLNIQSRFHGLVVTNDDDEDTEPRNVNISIEKSDVSQPVLVERYRAKGIDYEAALLNARNTRYGFSQQDSVLKFDYKLHRLGDEMWHGEEIELVLKVPVNTTLIIDGNLRRYIDVDINQCNNLNKTYDAPYARFTMTDAGIQCKVDTLKTDTLKVDSNAKKLIIFFVFILARKQRPHTRHVVKWQVVNSYYIYQEMIGFVMPVIKK